MKRCPACRRDYFDDSLVFCLDDGSSLLEGPGSLDEPSTAIIAESGSGPQSEAPTRSIRDARERTPAARSSTSKKYLYLGVGLMLLVFAGAFVGFRYLPSGGSRQIDSIAVMPFTNATGNSDLEYLSDGMTDMLIGSLGKIPNLHVKSRASVFRFKERPTDPRTAGGELGVPAIINGRVVQRGEEITLYIELVDTATENSLWQNTYNKRLADLVTLQSEVARDVARKLGARLSGADEDRLSRGYTADPEAYQSYMRGRFHTLRVTRHDLLKAIPYLQRAIELDPNYALAYVGLADAYRGLPLAGELDPQEYFPKAKAAALKAVEIDGELAEAHAVLGWVIFWYDWDWEEAERHCRRALELDPASGDAHMALAHILSSTGRHDEAVATARRGREIDPLNIRTSTLEAQFLIYAGRPDEAIERLNKVLELDPDYWFAYQFLASALIEKGRFDDAITAGQKGMAIYPENTRNAAFNGYALARAGRTEEARFQLDSMSAMQGKQFVPPFSFAVVNLGLGDRREAIRWLQRGIVARDPRMVFILCEPKLQGLRGDPDFEELLRRMRFTN